MRAAAKSGAGRRFAGGLLLLVLAALALRLAPAELYYNAYDLESYNIPWAVTAHESWLSMYENTLGLYPLDYSPLLPTLFGLFGGAMQLSQEVGGAIAANGMPAMVLIKLWPVLFDVGTAALLYYFTVFFFTQRMRERYLLPALVLAALCALCTRRRGYALLAGGLAATTLFNQFLVLHYVHGAPLGFRQALGQNLRLGAAANLALWCAALVLVLGPAVRRALRAVHGSRAAGG